MLKAVFDINQEERWETLIANLYNSTKRMEELSWEHLFEVVIMGSGIQRIITQKTSTSDYEKLKKLADKGVKFYVCSNSIKHQNLLLEDLYDFVQPVPAEVVELIIKQQNGYSYIKP